MKVLKAKEGMWLTQSADIPSEERVFTDSVFLAVNDSEDRWRDATNEEKDEWERLMEERVEEEEEAYEQEG